jgi:RNA polymerase sigma-70 factor (ECF subfamily)
VDIVRREERRRTDQEVEQELVETPDAGETIELAYYGGYTQSELAERLDQPLGTIKSRMFAGMTSLRELLASEAVGEASRT